MVAGSGLPIRRIGWANAAKHYDEEQLAALVSLIAENNAWNRLNVSTRRPGGDYQPGQRG